MAMHLSEIRQTRRLKQESYKKPVMITEYGSVEFVFMTIKQYEELKKESKK